MNPIFSWIVAHTVGKKLAVTCPKCGRRFVLPEEQKRRPIRCKGCGAEIQPPKNK